MKKKLLLLCLAGSLILLPQNAYAGEETKNSYEMDGITITVEEFTIEDFNNPDTQYSHILSFDFTIKNDTDIPYGYTTYWEGQSPDGKQLETYIDFMNIETNQVPAKSEIKDSAKFLVEDNINMDDSISVTYPFMNYDEEYWSDFQSVMYGLLAMNEWESKYSYAQDLTFELSYSSPEKQEETSATEFSYENSGYTFKYLKNEVFKDPSSDSELVAVYFEYTNNSGQTTRPAGSLNVKAFQNGVEMDWTIPSYDMNMKEADMAFKDVQNGATVDIALLYRLSDESDVSLEINPSFYSDQTDVGEYTFKLTK